MAFTKVIVYMFASNNPNLLQITGPSLESNNRPIFKFQRGIEVPYGSEPVQQLPIYVQIFKLLLQVAFYLVHTKPDAEQPSEEVSRFYY